MGVTELVLELQAHKATIKGVSKRLYAGKMITTCWSLIGHLFDIIFKDTNKKVW